MDDSKVNSGFLDGLYKSKKLGLTTSFVATCFGILPTVASQIMQIALLSAAVLSVVVYLISQAIVEAAWGHAAEEEDTEVVEGTAPCSVPPGSTTTLAAK